MIEYSRVVDEIQNVGLYDFISQDIQKSLEKSSLSKEDILDAIKKDPKILEEYRSTNVVNNISNIHIENIVTDAMPVEALPIVQTINTNLDILRDIEKYTLSFEESPTLVFIFSIEFFVLFSVQYFIVLLGLKEWQWEIYGAFAFSVVIAWMYAKKQKQKYEINNKKFQHTYAHTKRLMSRIGLAEELLSKTR